MSGLGCALAVGVERGSAGLRGSRGHLPFCLRLNPIQASLLLQKGTLHVGFSRVVQNHCPCAPPRLRSPFHQNVLSLTFPQDSDSFLHFCKKRQISFFEISMPVPCPGSPAARRSWPGFLGGRMSGVELSTWEPCDSFQCFSEYPGHLDCLCWAGPCRWGLSSAED